ncbi:uncharacterized protein LAESUDRAFT_649305 [Laetiporus sulphureus 93-53]|uniref:CREG-like beta-barrel domain-containing protein n=1 Tax=Laetiporus sulphureus 93-53 TaxID=1314785 RepID=A0A165F3W8_9APHY|nr:uncharacterized protein LAESUDRAFT_649305 [Laetiporus sulphureus 93-53]KZT08331.1 hypothetical protein LAESUDRAFT_649305 [Laetiporus sulphureus 93-53]
MATVYPAEHAALAGEPFSLQEYYASCHNNGSLTLLFMPISRHSQNIMASPHRSASISVTGEHPDASRARVALVGNVTIFKDINTAPDLDAIQSCYLAKHPDARRWLPGPKEPHIAYWARFDPHTIYYVGGFGSQHYIGYVPLALYQSASPSATDEEWAEVIMDSQEHLREW